MRRKKQDKGFAPGASDNKCEISGKRVQTRKIIAYHEHEDNDMMKILRRGGWQPRQEKYVKNIFPYHDRGPAYHNTDVCHNPTRILYCGAHRSFFERFRASKMLRGNGKAKKEDN